MLLPHSISGKKKPAERALPVVCYPFPLRGRAFFFGLATAHPALRVGLAWGLSPFWAAVLLPLPVLPRLEVCLLS